MTNLAERAKEALESQDTFAIMAWSADFARALIAADELAKTVEAMTVAAESETDDFETVDDMLSALNAYRAATGDQS